MRGKDDLFHLIKAMSKSEKRYFTLDAKKSGKEGAKYLNLFQTINGMEEYNDQKLKTKFKKSLSSDKGYLYEAILRSMRDYRSAKSRAAQIKERIMDSRYLYERGLYNQFEERLQDAKDMAVELDDNFTLLEIIKEEQLAKQNLTIYSQEYLKSLEKISIEKSQIIKAVSEESKYLDVYFNLFTQLTKEYVLKEEEKREALKNEIPKEILCEDYSPKTPHAQLRFLKCKAIYFQLIGDDDKVFECWTEVLDWWEKFPKIKEEKFFNYLRDFSNLISTCFKYSKYSHLIPEKLDKIKQEKPRNANEQSDLFHIITVSRLLYHLNKRDFEGARDLVPEIDLDLKKYNLSNDVVIVGNIVFLYFILGDYTDSFNWAKRIIETKSENREDIQRIIRILHFISIYEMDDIDLLESTARTITRYFKKKKISSSAFEALVFNQLKKIFYAPLSDKKTILNDFEAFLIDKQQQSNGKQVLGLEVLLIWLDKQ